jgi:hypothetical protein
MYKAAAILAAGIASALAAMAAQGQTSAGPKRLCFRGRPATVCRAFLLTEAGYYARLAGSDFAEQFRTASFEREHLTSHVSWELGGMVNRGSSTAIGATVLFGMDGHGERRGIKGRYRRWFDNGNGTFDASAGLLIASVSAPHPDNTLEALGPTIDVAVGWRDLVAGTARAEMLRRRDGQTVNATYVGVRLGSYPAVIGTAAAAIVVGVMIALIFGGGDF